MERIKTSVKPKLLFNYNNVSLSFFPFKDIIAESEVGCLLLYVSMLFLILCARNSSTCTRFGNLCRVINCVNPSPPHLPETGCISFFHVFKILSCSSSSEFLVKKSVFISKLKTSLNGNVIYFTLMMSRGAIPETLICSQ